MRYKAIVDGKYEFTDLSADGIDLVDEGGGRFHILVAGKSYQAVIESADWEKRVIRLQLNGRVMTVRLEDEYDQLVDQLGLKIGHQNKVKNVVAPMPGLVLKIDVDEGQEITADSPLLVLEAMKMENVIKATADGKIKSIHAEAGEAVDKGQLLIEME